MRSSGPGREPTEEMNAEKVVQILCHTGYDPHRQSYDERFGLTVPAVYGARDVPGARP